MFPIVPLLIALFQGGPPPTPVGEEVLLRFNSVAAEANQVRAERGIEAAIEVYEDALTDPANEGYGQFHLRLGQLYKRIERLASAAHHFQKCSQDVRVDSVDREIICDDGFKKVTSLLYIDDLPDSAKVIVIYPEQFAGPIGSRARLPRGEVRLVVEAPDRHPREAVITLLGEQRWRARLGMTKRDGPLVPEGFGAVDVSEPPPPKIAVGQPIRWPAYTAAAVGGALLGTGIYLGIDNRTFLNNIRLRQEARRCGIDACSGDLDRAAQIANVADGLWISGAILAVSSIGFYFLFDGGDGGEE